MLEKPAGTLSHSSNLKRTSLGDLGKGKACTPLKIYVIRIDEGAQCPQGFASEEIGLGTLQSCQRESEVWGHNGLC